MPATMLRARVITAVVLLALLCAAAAWSRVALLGLLALLAAVALYEWLKLAGCGRAVAVGAAAAYGVVLAGGTALEPHLPDRATASVALAASAAWCGLGAAVALAERRQLAIRSGASIVLAVALLTAGWVALNQLLLQGLAWLVSLLAVVWIADIAAYFSGRALGRRKLAPRISPGKTWEGVYGALALVTVAALTVHRFWPQTPVWSNRVLSELGWPLAVPCLWVIVALSVVGDLFESLLKRQAQVKDSGTLLPGHGGVLDRIDATLPVLPAAVLIDWWTR
jgi:phosphatidate cytidylyltransferase